MTYRELSAIAALAFVMHAPVVAQPAQLEILSQPEIDSPIGVRNPNGPPELAEFDFVIGDWDVDIHFTSRNGQELNYAARWHNIWIANGMVVFQEWRGPYITGVELRQYNRQAGHWMGTNNYPGPRGPIMTTGHRSADRMVINVTLEGPDGPYLGREVYTDIETNSFRMYAEESHDDGETWEAGRYRMTAMRATD